MIKFILTEYAKETISENKEFIEKWIKGLRSGKYTQTRGAMVDPDLPNSACCLMVMEMECNGRKWEEGSYTVDEDEVVEGSEWGTFVVRMPSEFSNGVRWPQILEATVYGCTSTLVGCASPHQWNDRYGLTFNQIADLLEHGEVEVPNGLF